MFIKLTDVSPEKLARLHALADSDKEAQRETGAYYLQVLKSSLNEKFGGYTVEIEVPVLAVGDKDVRKDRVRNLTDRTIIGQVFDILEIFPEPYDDTHNAEIAL
ncbi:hypothetical protein HYT05_01775 [Candidatus Kaiserbacteria bacterium]|nr:hypothetical protein [Candidatus Kaiserbacteria bacterium]